MCILIFGFLSSKRYGLDRVAVKHVVVSFRFAIFVALLVTNAALNIRIVYTLDEHPSTAASFFFLTLLFCLCILLDCSPHLPRSVQIYISVNARTNEMFCINQRVSLMSIYAGCVGGPIRILHIFLFSRCIFWSQSRLFPRSWSVQNLRCDSEALHLQQHPVADYASACVTDACARHQKLRQRIGTAPASARMRQHVAAVRSSYMTMFFVIYEARLPHAP